MNTFTLYNRENKPNENEQKTIVDFLHTHLGVYGDDKKDILKCLKFAIGDSGKHSGGFVLIIKEEETLKGITIINETGMSGYIPENILVYIAVNQNFRGKGIGKQLMEKALEIAKGDVALHVDHNNPAKKLYERLGFENKYLEMRYKK
ncbi:GNAT family N-acetyltransferase [Mesonia maritima]|uniref:GNAT superfamily N-acetyltransferase n=1 Tax=Mesonia maritima TaxID=1793873 RepID=A0ABU1K8G2_9FLAO|nr:GNAT family N-acetyltransferase [Mesonia maritima]MDR6301886.1 GNAT superfamily N-acetyltransferase [Mesonia maritima]